MQVIPSVTEEPAVSVQVIPNAREEPAVSVQVIPSVTEGPAVSIVRLEVSVQPLHFDRQDKSSSFYLDALNYLQDYTAPKLRKSQDKSSPLYKPQTLLDLNVFSVRRPSKHSSSTSVRAVQRPAMIGTVDTNNFLKHFSAYFVP